VSLTRRDFLVTAAAVALVPDEPLPRSQLRALRAAVRGPVFAPGGSGYNRARTVFNRRFAGVRPPAVVRVKDVADVQAVVRWADTFGRRLVARSGGNSYIGGSTSRRAVVVDVGGLDRISLSDRIVTLGPGARLIDVYAELAGHGVSIPAGSCPMVAVGGHVLGGGFGLASRRFGLALDRVRSLDVVTADGVRRRVDETHEPDLFWALRGGGGSFGIVTALRLRVARVHPASYFSITYPSASREEALAAWDDLAPGAPHALTSILSLSTGGANAFGQYLGSESALRSVVAPLTRIPGAHLTTGHASYLALQRRWAGCASGPLSGCHRDVPITFDASSVYVGRRLSASGRRAFVAAADTGATLLLDAYGGAVAEVEPRATAFVHRHARFSTQILSYAPIGTARARVRAARAKIAPHGNGQAYQNYADLDIAHPLRAYYGVNRQRLQQIKAAVDPADRFHVAQGIRL
jgi:FAD/FMN-containing dehydrogenase